MKYSQRLVLKVAIWSCGDKIPLMDLLLGVFETSAERFGNLGEALALYPSAVEDSLIARYDNLVLHHYGFRLFHPGKTKHLKEIMSELNRLEFDYMKYYLDVIEK